MSSRLAICSCLLRPQRCTWTMVLWVARCCLIATNQSMAATHKFMRGARATELVTGTARRLLRLEPELLLVGRAVQETVVNLGRALMQISGAPLAAAA